MSFIISFLSSGGWSRLRFSGSTCSGTLRLEDIIIENLLSFPLSCASLWTCLSSDLSVSWILVTVHREDGKIENLNL